MLTGRWLRYRRMYMHVKPIGRCLGSGVHKATRCSIGFDDAADGAGTTVLAVLWSTSLQQLHVAISLHRGGQRWVTAERFLFDARHLPPHMSRIRHILTVLGYRRIDDKGPPARQSMSICLEDGWQALSVAQLAL